MLVVALPRAGRAAETATGSGALTDAKAAAPPATGSLTDAKASAPPATGSLTDAKASAPANSRDAVLRKARQHFEDGKKAFDAKDYPAALKEFKAGYELEPRPGFLLNMAHATQKTGDLPGARELYTRFLQTNPVGEERRVAEEAIAELDRKLGTTPAAVVAPVEGAGAPAAGVVAAGTTPPGPTGGPAPGAPPGTGSAAPSASSALPGLPDSATQPSDSNLIARPAAPDEGTPVYKRWWLWTGIGVVAVGVAAFLVFGAKGGDSRDNGSWGQIKL
jgi:hypothetical protein